MIDPSERSDFADALAFLRKLEESISDIMLIGLGKEKAASGATEAAKAQR